MILLPVWQTTLVVGFRIEMYYLCLLEKVTHCQKKKDDGYFKKQSFFNEFLIYNYLSRTISGTLQ